METPTNFEAEEKAPAPAKAARKPISKAKKSRDTKRFETKRIIENSKTISSRNAEIDKKYLIEDREALSAILQREIQYKKQLQTSSRGAGIAVVATLSTLNKLKTPPRPETIPMHQLYRVILSLVEEKFAKIFEEKRSGLSSTENIRDVMSEPSRLAALNTLVRLPNVISGYVDNLGHFTHDNMEYVPTQPVQRFTEEGQIIPEAGNVNIENIRLIVLALANAQTNAATRRRFIRENPIPGAVFDEDGILVNPHAIMPAAYTVASLRQDVRDVNNFFSSIEKGAMQWLAPPPSIQSGKGTPAVYAATERIVQIRPTNNLAVLANDGILHLDDSDYYADIRLKPVEWAMGAIGFYREPPNHARDRYPYWDGVARGYATHHAILNAKDTCWLVYRMSC